MYELQICIKLDWTAKKILADKKTEILKREKKSSKKTIKQERQT